MLVPGVIAVAAVLLVGGCGFGDERSLGEVVVPASQAAFSEAFAAAQAADRSDDIQKDQALEELDAALCAAVPHSMFVGWFAMVVHIRQVDRGALLAVVTTDDITLQNDKRESIPISSASRAYELLSELVEGDRVLVSGTFAQATHGGCPSQANFVVSMDSPDFAVRFSSVERAVVY